MARQTLGAAANSAWGMSENGTVTTTQPDNAEAKTTSADGCSPPGVELRIIDPASRVLPDGAQGRLQVRGCSNFPGYLARPGLDSTGPEGWSAPVASPAWLTRVTSAPPAVRRTSSAAGEHSGRRGQEPVHGRIGCAGRARA
ncbi:hypothetical protein GCM10011504_15220 [Siccirubricoccus deserti]|uniref:AMP-binding protein n=2 Tax=Siccirubricoccus deserti TaxID=2013562 RepID=A0A9X0QWK1_9PROT|nr:AMP-binding protein [Siccirubricoccus deserti]GGC37813.1 hypothetical protein GCM10011504_15220 [Siccirubricoccus deserti]